MKGNGNARNKKTAEKVVSVEELYKKIEEGALDLTVLNKQSRWKYPVNVGGALIILGGIGYLAYESSIVYWDYGNEGADKLPWGGTDFNKKVSGPFSFGMNGGFNFYYVADTLVTGILSLLYYRLQARLKIFSVKDALKIGGLLVGAALFSTVAMYPVFVLSGITGALVAEIATAIVNIDLNLGGAYGAEKLLFIDAPSFIKWLWKKGSGFCFGSTSLPREAKDIDTATNSNTHYLTKQQFLDLIEKRLEELKQTDDDSDVWNKKLFEILHNDDELSSKTLHEKLSGKTDTEMLLVNGKKDEKNNWKIYKIWIIYIADKTLYVGLQTTIQWCGGVSMLGLYYLTLDSCAQTFKIESRLPKYIVGSVAFLPDLGLTILVNNKTINELSKTIKSIAKTMVNIFFPEKKSSSPKYQARRTYWYHWILNAVLRLAQVALFGLGIFGGYESSSTSLQLNAQYGFDTPFLNMSTIGGIVVFNGYGFWMLVLLLFTTLSDHLFFSKHKRDAIHKVQQVSSFGESLPDEVEIYVPPRLDSAAMGDDSEEDEEDEIYVYGEEEGAGNYSGEDDENEGEETEVETDVENNNLKRTKKGRDVTSVWAKNSRRRREEEDGDYSDEEEEDNDLTDEDDVDGAEEDGHSSHTSHEIDFDPTREERPTRKRPSINDRADTKTEATKASFG